MDTPKVFQMIKTLETEEKKAILQRFKVDVGEKILPVVYKLISDIISRDEGYDEQTFIYKLKRNGLEKQAKFLPQLFYRLYEYVLQIQLENRASITPERKCYESINRIEYLCDKGLMDHAEQLLDKLLHYVLVIDRSDLRLSIMLHCGRLEDQYGFYAHLKKETQNTLKDYRSVTEELVELQKHRQNYYDFHDLYIQKRVARDQKEIEEICSKYGHLLTTPIPEKITAHYYYKKSQSMIYDLTGDYDIAQKTQSEITDLIESNEDYLEAETIRYLNNLLSLSNRYQSGYDFPRWLECIRKIYHINSDHPYIVFRKKLVVIGDLLSYYTPYYNTQKMTYYTDKLAILMENLKFSLPINSIITYYFLLINYGIIVKNELAKRIGQNYFYTLNTQTLLKQHYYGPYLCLTQIIHFEQKEYSLLLHKTKNILAIYKKIDRDFSIEIAVLKALIKLSKTREQAKIIAIVEKTIAIFYKLVEDPIKKTGLLYFDYTCWLNAYKNRRTMCEEFEAENAYYRYPNPKNNPPPEDEAEGEFVF